MNETIQTLGSLGEFVGAILIAGTLIYLAIQTSATSKNVEIVKGQNISNVIARFNEKLAESHDAAEIWLKGREEQSLTPVEELRFHSLWVLWAHVPRVLWNAGEHHPEQYYAWVRSLSYPGIRKKYEAAQMPKELREVLDAIAKEFAESDA